MSQLSTAIIKRAIHNPLFLVPYLCHIRGVLNANGKCFHQQYLCQPPSISVYILHRLSHCSWVQIIPAHPAPAGDTSAVHTNTINTCFLSCTTRKTHRAFRRTPPLDEGHASSQKEQMVLQGFRLLSLRQITAHTALVYCQLVSWQLMTEMLIIHIFTTLGRKINF